MFDLSIIIVSWNTRQLLRECLQSLYRYTTGVAFEVFVVDNNSSDGSPQMIRHNFPHVVLIENRENVGFSKANNQAIKISKGRYIALLNPDALLIENVFSPLIKYADLNEGIGAIGPRILCGDGKTIQYVCARRLPNLYFDFCRLSGLQHKFHRTKLFAGINMSHWDHKSSRFVEALSGACMVVRKTSIDLVGLMDENQFMYGDEIDWCRRLLNVGLQIYYYPAASIIHYGGESSNQVKLLSNIAAEKAQFYFYKKHKGTSYAYLFAVQVVLFSFSKYLWSIFFRKKNKEVRELMNIYKSLFTCAFKKLWLGKA
jgi:GT2 family glycosyltransferase